MDIKVSGSNMSVGNALTGHVEEHLGKHVKKYFEKAVNANVSFSKEGDSSFQVNIIVNEGIKGGIVIKSDASANDVYGCFNDAAQKAAKQLRRYKRKIKNYRREKGGLKGVNINSKAFAAQKYVLTALPYDDSFEEEIELEELKNMPVEQDLVPEVEESLPIIAEKLTDIEELTVDQAVMQMDLLNLPTLVFINKDNTRLNVVYHRKDGNISWIDPKLT